MNELHVHFEPETEFAVDVNFMGALEKDGLRVSASCGSHLSAPSTFPSPFLSTLAGVDHQRLAKTAGPTSFAKPLTGKLKKHGNLVGSGKPFIE